MANIERKIRMRKTFRRFIFSFCAVLIFPVICFISLFQISFREIYEEKLLERVESNLDSAGGELDRNLEALHAYVNYNVLSEQFVQAIKDNELGEGDVREMLRTGVSNYPLLQDICYYNDMYPNRIYTSTGTYEIDYYAKLYIGQGTAEDFLQQLTSIRWSGWTNWKNGLQYIVKDPDGDWWIFQISMSDLKNVLEEEGAFTMLVDVNGKVLYQTEGDYQENKYIITYESDREIHQLVRYLNEDLIFSELNDWQRNFIIVTIIIMLLGGGMVIVLTFYNENPLTELLTLIRGKVDNIPKDMGGYDAIRFALKSMEEQNILLEEKQRRNQLLLRLIYGMDCESPYFKERMEEEGLFTNAECWRVVLITSAEKQEVDVSKITLYLGMIQKPETEFRQISFSDQKMVICIVGMTRESEKEIGDILQKMAENIQESVDESLRFFVGGRYSEPEKVSLSYSQAFEVFQKDRQEEPGNVVFYSFRRKDSTKFIYPRAELSDLYEELIAGNVSKVMALTNLLIAVMTEQESNRFVYNSLYYDVINAYYRAISELEVHMEGEILETDQLVVRKQSDAVRIIRQIMEQYEKAVEGRKTDSGREEDEELIRRVIVFIDENSQSADLNVSMVADNFKLSISNLSHKFKEQTNRTISDYITEKRFTYACRLLRETDYSVKDIAAMLGYGKPYSFIRMFKQRFGMTPVEYRNQKE